MLSDGNGGVGLLGGGFGAAETFGAKRSGIGMRSGQGSGRRQDDGRKEGEYASDSSIWSVDKMNSSIG